MMIKAISRDNGKPVWINTDYITEVDPIENGDGETYSRVYLAAGHRTFIDVTCSENLCGMINERESRIPNEISRAIEHLAKIHQEIRKK